MCVFRLSMTNTIRSASGYISSTISRTLGPIFPRSPFCYFDASLAGQGLEDHKQIGDPVASVFMVVSSRSTGSNRHRHSRLTDQLLARLVQANLRTLWVIRPFVHVQHVLHVPDELRILLGRNTPLLLQPRFKFVFFRTPRTVSYDNEAIYSNVTILSANNRNVQRLRPAGGDPHANAIRWASSSPSIFRR